MQALAALRLQYSQGDYSLHTNVPEMEDFYPVHRLRARVAQSTKASTTFERTERKRSSFLEGTLRRSFRSGSVSKQKVEEEQMLDMWLKEEVLSTKANITDKWKKLLELNPEQCMTKYMALIKEWPGYGSTLFEVEVGAFYYRMGFLIVDCRSYNYLNYCSIALDSIIMLFAMIYWLSCYVQKIYYII